MSESSQLVFYGEILPGYEADVVKAKLGELLKLPSEQVDTVFSGRRVVLRKHLPSEQAASYVARLEKIGVKVFVEALPQATDVSPAELTAVAETVPVAPAPEPVASPVLEGAALATEQIAAVEEMDCPKCGEHQPRRTLCRACSVDMKRFAESQQQAEADAREERMMAREVALASGGRGGYAALPSEDSVGLFGLGFSGRLGRRSYLVGNLLCWAILGFAVLGMIKLNSLLLAVLGVAIATFISIRLSVLRCHDINWSGWPTLIFFIPYIGPLFGLVLLFIAGTKGDNNYGLPSASPGFPVGFAMLMAFVFSMGVLYKQQDEILLYAMNKAMGGDSAIAYTGKYPQQSQPGRQTSTQGASQDGHDSAPVHTVAMADVEMFTTSSCGVCHTAKAYMNKRGIRYTEKDVEQNEDYLRDFYARGGRGVPYIFVGDQSMMGFDPDWLERVLANAR